MVGREDYLQIIYEEPNGDYKPYLIKCGTFRDFIESMHLDEKRIIDTSIVTHTYVFNPHAPAEVDVEVK